MKKETQGLSGVETAHMPLLQSNGLVRHNRAFLAYLELFHLTLLQVANLCGVRYLVTWKIAHDLPVSKKQAAQVRGWLERFTRLPYQGRIIVDVQEPCRVEPSTRQ